jgi:flagellar protein FliO/FliZ
MIVLSSTGESAFQLLIVFFIFIAVLVLAYFSTRFIANYQKTHELGKNIQVIESAKVSNNKFVEIVRAGDDRYFFIGIGKDEIVLLGELSKDEIHENFNQEDHESFKDIIKKASLFSSTDKEKK